MIEIQIVIKAEILIVILIEVLIGIPRNTGRITERDSASEFNSRSMESSTDMIMNDHNYFAGGWSAGSRGIPDGEHRYHYRTEGNQQGL